MIVRLSLKYCTYNSTFQMIQTNGKSVAGSFCQMLILSTGHFVNRSFCQQVILSTGHFISTSFCQPIIFSTWHFIKRSFFKQVIFQWVIFQCVILPTGRLNTIQKMLTSYFSN